MAACLNCSEELNGNKYCGVCGQRRVAESLNLKVVLGDAWLVVTDLDNRWYRTFRELFTRPGLMISDYVGGKRIHYAGPVQYFLVVMAIGITLSSLSAENFPLSGGVIGTQTQLDEVLAATMRLIEGNPIIYVLLLSPLAAVLTWISFVRRGKNFAEILVLTLYFVAQCSLIIVAISKMGSLINLLTGSPAWAPQVIVFLFISLLPLYVGWTYSQFFEIGIVRGLLSGFFVLLGFTILLISIYAMFALIIFRF